MTNFAEDPTKALDEMRQVCRRIYDTLEKQTTLHSKDVARFVEMFEDLDEHLAAGGDAPVQWAAEEEKG